MSRVSLEENIGGRLLSQTPSLLPMVERIATAACYDVTVLLTGETGTGKTYLARLIHECSPRQAERFLMVPCGALSTSLIESELFGHEKGVFTAAADTKVGKFAAAGAGTILLDEVDTLGVEAQSKLLRVMETGKYEPVGSNETRLCRARVLVACNSDLKDAVQSGRFRQDLYYRLNVFAFHLAPLRERQQDIAPLVRQMIGRFSQKFGKQLTGIAREALALLERFPWPGNIRQLENVVQQAVVLNHGPELLPSHLPASVRYYCGPVETTRTQAQEHPLRHDRESGERAVIQQALKKYHYDRARTARDEPL